METIRVYKELKPQKPKLQLTGQNGNAFMVLGLAQRASKKAKWSKQQWEEYKAKATSGDYNNLITVTMEYFNVS